jgi:hypothetical protein
MTELKNLVRQLQFAANNSLVDRNSGRPVLAMRWTIDVTSGRPMCHWVARETCTVIRLAPFRRP